MGHNCHFSNCWPSNSDGHNFFVRTPFRVFLDSMEIPLSQDSSRMPLEDSGDHNFAEIYVLHQVCKLLSCIDVNSQVLT